MKNWTQKISDMESSMWCRNKSISQESAVVLPHPNFPFCFVPEKLSISSICLFTKCANFICFYKPFLLLIFYLLPSIFYVSKPPEPLKDNHTVSDTRIEWDSHKKWKLWPCHVVLIYF